MSDIKVPIRILLVDDEEDLVSFLSHRLLKRGFTVTATTSGREAIEACRVQKFDVAIVDLKMPEMDGIAVVQHLREQQPFIETIMLTGHGSHDSAWKAGKLDTFRYLIKPYEFDQLLELIREAHTIKLAKMEKEFQAKFDALITGNTSPREIMIEGDKLRREYEQD